MSSGKILLGVMAGVAAGALTGILFAPDKGIRTRRRILEKSKGYADELKRKFDKYCESLIEGLESMENNEEKFV